MMTQDAHVLKMVGRIGEVGPGSLSKKMDTKSVVTTEVTGALVVETHTLWVSLEE